MGPCFLIYVRPLVDYNSTVLSPHLKHDITSIDSVQRRFTKLFSALGNIRTVSGLNYLI